MGSKRSSTTFYKASNSCSLGLSFNLENIFTDNAPASFYLSNSFLYLSVNYENLYYKSSSTFFKNSIGTFLSIIN